MRLSGLFFPVLAAAIWAIPASAVTPAVHRATAIFAGGCFWSAETDLDKIPGVLSTTSGYTGGTAQRPSYDQVSGHGTGHLEAVRVTYDPTKISYLQLTRRFLRTIDVVDGGGQFCDRGDQYRTAVFVADPGQQAAAAAAIREAGQILHQPIATSIRPASAFWPAESYHQDYEKKNPIAYRMYRLGCGRDRRLAALWHR